MPWDQRTMLYLSADSSISVPGSIHCMDTPQFALPFLVLDHYEVNLPINYSIILCLHCCIYTWKGLQDHILSTYTNREIAWFPKIYLHTWGFCSRAPEFTLGLVVVLGVCCLLSWVAERFLCACELGCQTHVIFGLVCSSRLLVSTGGLLDWCWVLMLPHWH